MSAKVNRTPKSGRQSLFLNDLATPISSRRGKFSTPGQAAAVSALWRENFSSSDLPPPPVFTLEDRADFSPEMGIADYPMSPDPRSDPRTPILGQGSGGRELSLTPLKGRSEPSTSYGVSSGSQLNQQGGSGLSWMSPGRGSDQEDRGKGSPVEGVVQPGALITLPPPREVARPEKQRSTFPAGGSLDQEEWVTVYGFSPGDTNMVLREFEKCGIILQHVPGPRNANWMHILFQNRSDAQKALSKDGKQMNGVLIVGVKPVDPMQRQALSEMVNNQGFTSQPPPSCSQGFEPNSSRTLHFRPNNNNPQNGIRQPTGAIAAPAKSVVSKVMDLMFGV